MSQAFLYNAVFFTYALILTRFYGVPGGRTGIYLLPFAIGNFLGPLLLGRFFDTVGRRQMISSTYAISAVLLTFTGWAFAHGILSAIADAALDHHFLFCIGGRQRGLFDRQRNLSAGDSGVGDCFLFFTGYSGGRNRGAVAVRSVDRLGIAGKSVLWIPGRRRSDVWRQWSR